MAVTFIYHSISSSRMIIITEHFRRATQMRIGKSEQAMGVVDAHWVKFMKERRFNRERIFHGKYRVNDMSIQSVFSNGAIHFRILIGVTEREFVVIFCDSGGRTRSREVMIGIANKATFAQFTVFSAKPVQIAFVFAVVD